MSIGPESADCRSNQGSGDKSKPVMSSVALGICGTALNPCGVERLYGCPGTGLISVIASSIEPGIARCAIWEHMKDADQIAVVIPHIGAVRMLKTIVCHFCLRR
jgi:hypothetical protein